MIAEVLVNFALSRSECEFAESICTIFALIAVIVFFVLIAKSHLTFEDYHPYTFPKFIVGIIWVASIIFGLVFNNEKTNVTQQNLQNGYRVFINGIEVDADTIDIKQYSNIKVDDENKYIIITVKGD